MGDMSGQVEKDVIIAQAQARLEAAKGAFSPSNCRKERIRDLIVS